METIVNLWSVCGINFLASIDVVAKILIVCSIIAIILVFYVNYKADCDREDQKILAKIVRFFVRVFVISVVLAILIPNKEVMYTMLSSIN